MLLFCCIKLFLLDDTRVKVGDLGRAAGRYTDVMRYLCSPELVCSLVSGLGSRSRHPIKHN